jgi:hypothetical protein
MNLHGELLCCSTGRRMRECSLDNNRSFNNKRQSKTRLFETSDQKPVDQKDIGGRWSGVTWGREKGKGKREKGKGKREKGKGKREKGKGKREKGKGKSADPSFHDFISYGEEYSLYASTNTVPKSFDLLDS